MIRVKDISLHSWNPKTIMGISPTITYTCGKCGKTSTTKISTKTNVSDNNKVIVICEHCKTLNDTGLTLAKTNRLGISLYKQSSKILFLDIDGVLNSYFGINVDSALTHGDSKNNRFNTQNMIVLQFIVGNIPNLELIVFVDKKNDNLAEINDELSQYNINQPIKYLYFDRMSKSALIEQYCDAANIHYNDIVYISSNKLIYSDVTDIINRFIKTDSHDGLTYNEYRKLCLLYGINV